MPNPPMTMLLFDQKWRYALMRYAPGPFMVLVKLSPRNYRLTAHWLMLACHRVKSARIDA